MSELDIVRDPSTLNARMRSRRITANRVKRAKRYFFSNNNYILLLIKVPSTLFCFYVFLKKLLLNLIQRNDSVLRKQARKGKSAGLHCRPGQS